MAQGNSQFAAYATGSAFRIDLTKRMLQGLFAAANGKELTTSHHGAMGLLSRGLVTPKDAQPRSWSKDLEITEAGRKVAELCEMAGLGDIKEGG